MEDPTPAVDAVIVTLLIFFTQVVIAWLSRRSRNAMKKKLAEAMLALKQAEEKKREAEKYSADLDARYKPITDMEQHARLLLGKRGRLTCTRPL